MYQRDDHGLPINPDTVHAGAEFFSRPTRLCLRWKTNRNHNTTISRLPIPTSPNPTPTQALQPGCIRRRPIIPSPSTNPASVALPDHRESIFSRGVRHHRRPHRQVQERKTARGRCARLLQPWRARICCGGRRSSTLPSSNPPKVSNRRSRRWLNDRLLIELVPRLHVEEIKSLFAPPPWGEELPLSAFCRTSVGEWDAFRSIDMDTEASLMPHMKRSSEKQRTHVDEDELVALNAWRRIDRQTREAIKRNFLPDLLEIYEERVRTFIEDTSDKDVLVLNVQDPFQRLLLHGVCEFYNVTSKTSSSMRDGKPWKTTTIKKRQGTGVPPPPNHISYLPEDEEEWVPVNEEDLKLLRSDLLGVLCAKTW